MSGFRDAFDGILRPGWAAFWAGLSLAAAAPGAGLAVERMIDGRAVEVERMASRLDGAWGMAFLPNCEFLVSLKRGRVVHFDADGKATRLRGVPKVRNAGQGGLLDIEAARDFAESREIFLTYAKRQAGGGSGTALASARLSEDADALEDVVELFEMAPGSEGRRHFGSRVVEAPDGSLFATIGDRGDRPSAQDLSNHNGTVIRVNRDGSIPADNPFAGQDGILPEIWSYGHRNPQGAALDADGRLWISEHGARGGDEINLVLPGRNYGWPVISYGVHYSGEPIGEGFAKEGMEQPELYWDPSIAPSGMIVYSGRLWPEWAGQIFVGSLKFDYISRVAPGDSPSEVERIALPETRRVRDVREAPDGTIWFIAEDRDAIYRIAPSGPDFAPECAPRSR